VFRDHTSSTRKWVLASAVLLALAGAAYVARARSIRPPIKLGLLHSRTGAMAISEKSMIDAELMAIDEINAGGGILGRMVQPVVADGRSDWRTYAVEAERLIRDEKVLAIVGCWTSASRKTVRPVIEKYDHLLIYPMAYEGLEQSPNIIYTGAAPNQQITAAIMWSFEHLGRRFFLVGSDYVWPHSVNAIVSDQLKAIRAEKVGEEYIFFGSSDVGDAVEKIRQAKPDVIFSAVVGDSNIAFYKALKAAGIRADRTPVVSVSIGEDELRVLPVEDMVGHYAAWDYFQSIPRKENIEFVRRFKHKYGQDRVTSDVIQTAYFSVLLWAQAARESGKVDAADVRKAMLGQTLNAPEGVVSIDPETQHTWRSFSLGRIRSDRQMDIVWTSQKAIRPAPYPLSRSRVEWDDFLQNLYDGWKGNWANPTPPVKTEKKH
jgi:urea transport system substrate-binding protein